MSAVLAMSVTEIRSLAEDFYRSGYFKDASDKSKAVVKILAGQELGIPPFAAMIGIHIIPGKPPMLGANLIAALIKKSYRFDYKIIHLNNDQCELQFFENEKPIGIEKYTMEDAKRAMLASKDNWKHNPKDMLFARAISGGGRRFCASIFISGSYSEGDSFENGNEEAHTDPFSSSSSQPILNNPLPEKQSNIPAGLEADRIRIWKKAKLFNIKLSFFDKTAVELANCRDLQDWVCYELNLKQLESELDLQIASRTAVQETVLDNEFKTTLNNANEVENRVDNLLKARENDILGRMDTFGFNPKWNADLFAAFDLACSHKDFEAAGKTLDLIEEELNSEVKKENKI
jgi:hypothetical protein